MKPKIASIIITAVFCIAQASFAAPYGADGAAAAKEAVAQEVQEVKETAAQTAKEDKNTGSPDGRNSGGTTIVRTDPKKRATKQTAAQAVKSSKTKKKTQKKKERKKKAGQEEQKVAAPVDTAALMAKAAEIGNAIQGPNIAAESQCVSYLLANNPAPAISVTPEELVHYYFVEGERKGIRGDVAFAQAIKETGFFRYGGTVVEDQNNYCGLGTTSAIVRGGYFPNAETGVRAHIQHLLAYTATRRPLTDIVDPRYELVRGIYGDDVLSEWTQLNGRWAVPGDFYGESIMMIYYEILSRKVEA